VQHHRTTTKVWLFEGASKVAAKLGPEADNSGMTLQLLRELPEHHNWPDKMTAILQSPQRDTRFGALIHLLDREYWACV